MKLITILFGVALLLSSCGKEVTPLEVFEQYSNELNSVQKLTDFQFSEFLTTRAQNTVAEKLRKYSPELLGFDFSLSVNGKPVTLKNETITINASASDQDSIFPILLNMLREDSSKMSGVSEQLEINTDTAALTNIKENHPENGTTYTRIVYFVNENGWKIDRITTTSKSADSKISSSTYD